MPAVEVGGHGQAVMEPQPARYRGGRGSVEEVPAVEVVLGHDCVFFPRVSHGRPRQSAEAID